MKRRSIVALLLAVVTAAAVVATTSGATKKTAANTLTVWLQTDAQSGWPDVVAAASQQFQSDHPGWTVNVQYQSWGDHLQKLDTVLAAGGGSGSPDVVEMGNTETTKYMAAGAFANLSSYKAQLRELGELAQRPREVRLLRRQALRRSVLRRLARRHLPHRPLQEGRDLEASELDGGVRGRRAEAPREERQEGLLAGLHRRYRLVLRDGLRLRLRRGHRNPGQRQVEGPARHAQLARRSHRVQGLLHRRFAGEQDDG